MLRKLHAYPALVAALLVAFMALSGAILALEPVVGAIQTATGPAATQSESVAQLVSGVASNFNAPQRIERKPDGSVIVYYRNGMRPAADLVDPATGQSAGAYAPSAFFTFMTELHRSLFAGDLGRGATGVASLAMSILALSGIFMLVKRLGGWRKLFATARGTLGQRLHVEMGRLGVLMLTVTAVSGLWMSLSFFALVPDGTSGIGGFVLPPQSQAGTPADAGTLTALQDVPLGNLRELVFPAHGDPQDVFTLTTANGVGYIDQVTGALLQFTPNSFWQSVYQAVYTLHTGRGVWWYALLLGAAALTVPVMAYTGIAIWWRRQRQTPRLGNNASAGAADSVILVGSESNTTWGFAKSLGESLSERGHKVHIAPMNGLARRYVSAKSLFVLTSTHGDGAAPASASRFLARLDRFETHPDLRFAVLGFGDRSFPKFCAYAETVDQALGDKGLNRLADPFAIDRQSSQSFAVWGREIGKRLGEHLLLDHVPSYPKTTPFVLEKRSDFGQEWQSPRAILRFRPAAAGRGLFGRLRAPKYEAGDLFGIVPPGTGVARYYSLASGAEDGFVEICVSKQPGGLCSSFLHDLEPGDVVEGFMRANPDFRPRKGRAPVVMIGAGTGIAPFAGFMRNNRGRKPMYLYWGGRSADADFLYHDDLSSFRADGRLTGARFAFSRSFKRQYVQDSVREDAAFIAELIREGAQIMVCGGTAMAEGVRSALNDIATPLGTDVAALKETGRYLEDVY